MKQQIFIDNIHEYDYELLVNGNVNLHNLYYSDLDEWSQHIKGKIAMSIKDCGNGLEQMEKESSNRINYCEAAELFILLKLINSPAKYEIGTKKIL